ncbi:MAG: hypothetical protein JRJ04_07640 [Deltaproteobacteria bacterium]|nr:hypothetical protein [Deltaproteobacteria bacterium]
MMNISGPHQATWLLPDGGFFMRNHNGAPRQPAEGLSKCNLSAHATNFTENYQINRRARQQ